MIPVQQPLKGIPNQVDHRRNYKERKEAGLVHTNPGSGLRNPNAPPPVRVQRPNPALQGRRGALTLAEQLGMARQQQAATGAVAVTGNATSVPQTSRPAVPPVSRPNPALAGRQTPPEPPAVTVTPETNVLPPRPTPPQQQTSPPVEPPNFFGMSRETAPTPTPPAEPAPDASSADAASADPLA